MTGSGTLADPYVIWDVNDLQNMNLDLTAYYELGQDIDASATVGWNAGEGFIPVGSWPLPALPFTGHFDGKGYEITELYMNRPIALGAPDCNFQALFGYTWASGEIKNVGIVDCNITAFEWVGALVGFHSPGCGKVSNCYSTGIIKALVGVGGLLGYNGADVEDCHSDCEIICVGGEDASIEEVGGLIGENDGDILRSHATGNITASSNWGNWGIAGFVGLHSFRTIRQCYATGNVHVVDGGARPWESSEIGGFGGCLFGNGVSECFSTGNVHAMGVADWLWAIGGFAGYSDEDYLSDCYSRGNVYAEHALEVDCVGGFIGEWYARWGEELRRCYSTGSITTVGPTTIYIGGFCGKEEDYPGFILNCFWDTETSGMATSHGGTGKTTAQMKASTTFIDVGWGFGTIWGMTAACNNGYPCLLGVTPSCAWAPVVAPTVTANPVTNTEKKSITLNGTLDDDGGEACDCGFEWGETPLLGNTTPTQSRTTGQTFSYNLTGLAGGRTYYYRTVATNSEGTSYGTILSFTTKVGATVMTLPATDITENRATLHGKVTDDAGLMGSVRFQWGLTAIYGANTSWIGGHVTGDEFEYNLSSLTEGMGYHFRAQFKHNGQTTSGQDMVFHTLSPVGPLILMTEDQAYLLEASI